MSVSDVQSLPQIYPNPTGGVLRIIPPSATPYTVQLLSLDGQVVLYTHLQGDGTQTIDASHLDDGVYILRLTQSGGYTSQHRIVKAE